MTTQFIFFRWRTSTLCMCIHPLLCSPTLMRTPPTSSMPSLEPMSHEEVSVNWLTGEVHNTCTYVYYYACKYGLGMLCLYCLHTCSSHACTCTVDLPEQAIGVILPRFGLIVENKVFMHTCTHIHLLTPTDLAQFFCLKIPSHPTWSSMSTPWVPPTMEHFKHLCCKIGYVNRMYTIDLEILYYKIS